MSKYTVCPYYKSTNGGIHVWIIKGTLKDMIESINVDLGLVEKIRINYNMVIDDSDFALIGEFFNLKELEMQNCLCLTTLKPLRFLKKLEHLDIFFSINFDSNEPYSISCDGIENIKSLKHISIDNCTSVEPFKNLENLESLALQYAICTPGEPLVSLQPLAKLPIKSFQGRFCKEMGVEQLEWPLSFYGGKCSDLELLCKFENTLEHVQLDGFVDEAYVDLSPLKKLKRLKQLEIDFPDSYEELHAVMPIIKSLGLERCRLSQNGGDNELAYLTKYGWRYGDEGFDSDGNRESDSDI